MKMLAVKSHIAGGQSLLCAIGVAAIGLPLAATPAAAHVKWFAPYIVGAAPQPIMATLTNNWFWIAIAIIVIIAIDPTREMHFLPALKKSLRSVPVGLAAALVIIAGSYWGLHATLYGPEGRVPVEEEMTTHSPDPDHPHPEDERAEAQPHEHAGPVLAMASRQ